MVSVSLPADKMARLLAMLDGEAPKAEPQKPASTVKKADKPLFKPVKVRITTRVDADVLEAFKATGDGWQTRINDVLRQNMPVS
ncbi:BrnA antitoxin family protein [Mesorhizobium sp. B2-1-2]|nr:BrnA antitoxin family protein [Mesorhizobium sp. B2-1-2]